MSETSPAPSLTIPEFDPDDGIVVADVFPSPWFDPTEHPEAPAMITVDLNAANLGMVALSINPAGKAVLARLWEDFRLTQPIWLDLHPAEALELAARLRIFAEAAAQFDKGEPDEMAEAVTADDTMVDA
jgi:hypothetical protein